VLHLRMFGRAFQIDGPACPKARLPQVDTSIHRNLPLTTICRSEMFVAVDAGDRSAEIDQVSSSHDVLTLVHLDAQPEPDPVSDVEPM